MSTDQPEITEPVPPFRAGGPESPAVPLPDVVSRNPDSVADRVADVPQVQPVAEAPGSEPTSG